METLIVTEPSSFWEPGTSSSRGDLSGSSLLGLPLSQGVSVAAAPATEVIYGFLSEKVFPHFGQSTSPQATVCALVFGAKGRSSWAERVILDYMLSQFPNFGPLVVDFVAVALYNTDSDTPIQKDLIAETMKRSMNLLQRETGAVELNSILDGLSLVSQSKEHLEADCFVYQLVVEGANDSPPSVFTLICVPPARVEVVRRIILWHELSCKRGQPASPPGAGLRKVVWAASALYNILLIDDLTGKILLPFVAAVARRMRCSERQSNKSS